MKLVIAMVLLIAGATAAYHYGSSYVMGGIEGGLPGGGNQQFKEYHDDNLVTKFLGGNKEDGFTQGDVSENPFITAE